MCCLQARSVLYHTPEYKRETRLKTGRGAARATQRRPSKLLARLLRGWFSEGFPKYMCIQSTRITLFECACTQALDLTLQGLLCLIKRIVTLKA